jgi:1-acyl-sn-glycerol-3-phosphate acyltransferase
MTLLRSALFAAALVLVTPPYALLALATFPLPRMARYRVISGWSRLVVRLARALCGIRWRIEGRERLPAAPAVILSKHQSAWEPSPSRRSFRRRCWCSSASCCGSRSSAGGSP